MPPNWVGIVDGVCKARERDIMRYTAKVLWTNAGTVDVATEADSKTAAKKNIEEGEFEMIGGNLDMPREYEISEVLNLAEEPRAVAKARRAAVARKRRQERAAERRRLKELFDDQYQLARSRVMEMAENGYARPIHFQVRVISGSIAIEKLFSLRDVSISRDCFSDERIASDPVIVVRKDSRTPAFVQEPEQTTQQVLDPDSIHENDIALKVEAEC